MNEVFKKCKIKTAWSVYPTNLVYNKDQKYYFQNSKSKDEELYTDYEYHNLYIYDDNAEISIGDWVIEDKIGFSAICHVDEMYPINKNVFLYKNIMVHKGRYRKIIATTNSYLQLPKLSNDFIKEFCNSSKNRDKSKIISEVLVEFITESIPKVVPDGTIITKLTNNKDIENKKELIKFLERKLKYHQKRIKELYPNGNNDEKLNRFGGWCIGYFEGRIELLEDILDILNNEDKNNI